eukprot:snap_masked-scaffold_58-processed-gene-0.71-mRNA-1 protein AED:1.00 eAED:1.00 QI:0/-1/0/0/-1/1/1/0/294
MKWIVFDDDKIEERKKQHNEQMHVLLKKILEGRRLCLIKDCDEIIREFALVEKKAEASFLQRKNIISFEECLVKNEVGEKIKRLKDQICSNLSGLHEEKKILKEAYKINISREKCRYAFLKDLILSIFRHKHPINYKILQPGSKQFLKCLEAFLNGEGTNSELNTRYVYTILKLENKQMLDSFEKLQGRVLENLLIRGLFCELELDQVSKYVTDGPSLHLPRQFSRFPSRLSPKFTSSKAFILCRVKLGKVATLATRSEKDKLEDLFDPTSQLYTLHKPERIYPEFVFFLSQKL